MLSTSGGAGAAGTALTTLSWHGRTACLPSMSSEGEKLERLKLPGRKLAGGKLPPPRGGHEVRTAR